MPWGVFRRAEQRLPGWWSMLFPPLTRLPKSPKRWRGGILAYWQAQAVADYRESLLRMQPFVTDETFRRAIGSLANFNFDEACRVIKEKTIETIRTNTKESLMPQIAAPRGEHARESHIKAIASPGAMEGK